MMKNAGLAFIPVALLFCSLLNSCWPPFPSPDGRDRLELLSRTLGLDESGYKLFPLVLGHKKSYLGRVAGPAYSFSDRASVYVTKIEVDEAPTLENLYHQNRGNIDFALKWLDYFNIGLQRDKVVETEANFGRIFRLHAEDFGRDKGECVEKRLVTGELLFEGFSITVKQSSKLSADLKADLSKASSNLPDQKLEVSFADTSSFTVKIPRAIYAVSTTRITPIDRQNEYSSEPVLDCRTLDTTGNRIASEARFTQPTVVLQDPSTRKKLSEDTLYIPNIFHLHATAEDENKLFPKELLTLKATIRGRVIEQTKGVIDTTLVASQYGITSAETFTIDLTASNPFFETTVALKLRVVDKDRPVGEFVSPEQEVTDVRPTQFIQDVKVRVSDKSSGVDRIWITALPLNRKSEKTVLLHSEAIGSAAADTVDRSIELNLSNLRRGTDYLLKLEVSDTWNNRSYATNSKRIRLVSNEPPTVVLNSPRENQQISLKEGHTYVDAAIYSDEALIDSVQLWVRHRQLDRIPSVEKDTLVSHKLFNWEFSDEPVNVRLPVKIRATTIYQKAGEAIAYITLVDDRAPSIAVEHEGSALMRQDTLDLRFQGSQINLAKIVVGEHDDTVSIVKIPDTLRSISIPFSFSRKFTDSLRLKIVGFDEKGLLLMEKAVSIAPGGTFRNIQ